MNQYNLVHKAIHIPPAMKIPGAIVVFDKDWDKLQKVPAWREYKVKSKKERGYLSS